jgi:hypothetical protein
MYFYVVSTVHFEMKLYNDQRNAQVFNLFIYLLLPYMFRGFLLAHLQRQVYNFGAGSSVLGMGSASEDLNHCRSCTPASEDVLKESLKHVKAEVNR